MYEVKQSEPALFSIKIQPNSCHCGIHLAAINIPKQCALLGLLRHNRVISASENPSISAGDFVLAVAFHPMMGTALKVVLKKVHPVYYSMNDCLLDSKLR